MRVIKILLVRSILVLAGLANLHTASAARMEDLMSSRSLAALNQAHEPASKKAGPQGRAESYAEIFELDSESTFEVVDSSELKGQSSYRFKQMFRGVPIHGATTVITEDLEGNVRYLDGDLVRGLAEDLPESGAALSSQQAIAIAKRTALTGSLADAKAQREKVETVIYLDDRSVAHLAYHVAFFAAHPVKSAQPNFFIDANTGEVLKQWNGIRNANATGPGDNKSGQYEYGTQRGCLDVTQIS